uniref:Uncharacterized protein n=1 Tax=Leersia perrieri TaxID=77586 RepID=A0A0D9WWN2_9ORYZ
MASASLPEFVQFDGHLLPVKWLEGDVLAEFLQFLDEAAAAEPQEMEMEEEEEEDPEEVEFEVEEEDPEEVEFAAVEGSDDDVEVVDADHKDGGLMSEAEFAELYAQLVDDEYEDGTYNFMDESSDNLVVEQQEEESGDDVTIAGDEEEESESEKEEEEEESEWAAYEREAEAEMALLMPHILAIPALMARAAETAPAPAAEEASRRQFVPGQRGWM